MYHCQKSQTCCCTGKFFPSCSFFQLFTSPSLRYFHGDISTAEAARRLSSPPTPCGFLLRFSTSEAGSFALSTFAPDASVHHYRIANLAGKYALKGSSTQYDSLIDLIQGEARALSLEKGCPCEAWTTFFNSRAEMLRIYQRAGVATFQ